jgi:hypothetical protein
MVAPAFTVAGLRAPRCHEMYCMSLLIQSVRRFRFALPPMFFDRQEELLLGWMQRRRWVHYFTMV